MNRSFTCGTSLGLAAIFFCLAGCGKKEPVRLEFKPSPGKSFAYQLTTDTVADMAIQGDSRHLEQGVTLRIRLDFGPRTPQGLMPARLTWTGLVFRQTTPAGTFRYDSAAPGTDIPPPARIWNALVNQSVDVVYRPDGRVAEVRGADALVTGMLGKLGVEATPETTALMQRQFSAEAIRENLERLTVFYPASGVVREGASWVKDTALSRGFPMRLAETFTLKSVQDGRATLEVKASVKPNGSAPPMSAAGQETRYVVSGDLSGTLAADLNDGMPSSAALQMTASGQQQIRDVASGKDFSCPFNLTVKTSLSRLQP